MKYKGESIHLLRTKKVTLWDGFDVQVNGLPVGYHKMQAERLPSPTPPKQPEFDAQGFPVYADRAKKEHKQIPNYDDPGFKALEEEQSRRQMAMMVYEGTQKDTNIEFEVERDGDSQASYEKFYQGVYDELVKSGIGYAYIKNLTYEILQVTGFTKEQIAEVQKVFLEIKG